MATWLRRIEPDEDNVRAALEWSMLHPHAAERGQRLAGMLHWFWFVRGRFSEARRRLDRLLEHAGTGPTARMPALVTGGFLAFWQGDFGAAQPLLEEGLALCRAANEPGWAAFAQCGLGAAASGRGEHRLARSHLDAALAAARSIGDRWVTAFALHFRAQCAANTGDVALASTLLQDCIDTLNQLGGNKSGTGFSLLHLGRLARRHGDLAVARGRVLDALRLFAELDDRRGFAYALAGLAGISLAAGDVRAAAHLFGASHTLRAVGGPFLEVALRTELEKDLATTRAALGDEAFNAVWEAGLNVPLDQTIAATLREATPRA